MAEVALTEKGKSWYKSWKDQVIEYHPYKGAKCKICGRFCRSNHTDSITGVRNHYCQHCDESFQSVYKPGFKAKKQECVDLETETSSEKIENVGRIPTSIDKKDKKSVKKNQKTPKK